MVIPKYGNFGPSRLEWDFFDFFFLIKSALLIRFQQAINHFLILSYGGDIVFPPFWHTGQ